MRNTPQRPSSINFDRPPVSVATIVRGAVTAFGILSWTAAAMASNDAGDASFDPSNAGSALLDSMHGKSSLPKIGPPAVAATAPAAVTSDSIASVTTANTTMLDHLLTIGEKLGVYEAAGPLAALAPPNNVVDAVHQNVSDKNAQQIQTIKSALPTGAGQTSDVSRMNNLAEQQLRTSPNIRNIPY